MGLGLSLRKADDLTQDQRVAAPERRRRRLKRTSRLRTVGCVFDPQLGSTEPVEPHSQSEPRASQPITTKSPAAQTQSPTANQAHWLKRTPILTDKKSQSEEVTPVRRNIKTTDVTRIQGFQWWSQ